MKSQQFIELFIIIEYFVNIEEAFKKVKIFEKIQKKKKCF
jgi:hypothetical protein